jgi:IS5 family transposase
MRPKAGALPALRCLRVHGELVVTGQVPPPGSRGSTLPCRNSGVPAGRYPPRLPFALTVAQPNQFARLLQCKTPRLNPPHRFAICWRSTICGLMLEAVSVYLEAKGIRIATGTIVNATIIHAPSSTKNASGEHDPEMHQARKGNQWYFGLKAHIGVAADCHMLPDLLHGEACKVWGDCGYQGQTDAIREAPPHQQDITCRRTKFKNYEDERSERLVESKRKSRTCVPHRETRLRLRQGESLRHRRSKTPQHRAPFAAAVQSSTCAGAP